jgi:hypothetical protein
LVTTTAAASVTVDATLDRDVQYFTSFWQDRFGQNAIALLDFSHNFQW